MPEVKTPSAVAKNPSQGYTLSGLFLLTATCAVGAQLWHLLLKPDQASLLESQSLVGGVSFFLGGLLLGLCIGPWRRPRRQNTAWWAAVGMAVGAFSGPLVVAEANARMEMTISLCAGGLLLIVLATVLHYVSPRRAEPEPSDMEKLFGAAGARQAVANSLLAGSPNAALPAESSPGTTP